MAYYPVADTPEPFCPPNAAEPRPLDKVHRANALVSALAEELGLEFIDVNRAVTDDRGYLRSEFAKDPVHMWPSAYMVILRELLPYLSL